MSSSGSIAGFFQKQLQHRYYRNHKAAIGNVAFSIYFSLVYLVLSDYFFSHGEAEIPVPFAVLALVFFFTEPLAIWYKTRIENYRRKSTETFSVGGFLGGTFIVLSRAVFRVLFLAVAIKSLAPQYWTEAVGWSLGLAALIKECHTMYLISKPAAIQPRLIPEVLTQFVLINQMALFMLFFTSLARHGLDYFKWGMIEGLFLHFMAFLICFLPNRIVEYYADYIDLKTTEQRLSYYLSVLWIYAVVVALARVSG